MWGEKEETFFARKKGTLFSSIAKGASGTHMWETQSRKSRRRFFYRTHDIAPLVQEGGNCHISLSVSWGDRGGGASFSSRSRPKTMFVLLLTFYPINAGLSQTLKKSLYCLLLPFLIFFLVGKVEWGEKEEEEEEEGHPDKKEGRGEEEEKEGEDEDDEISYSLLPSFLCVLCRGGGRHR